MGEAAAADRREVRSGDQLRGVLRRVDTRGDHAVDAAVEQRAEQLGVGARWPHERRGAAGAGCDRERLHVADRQRAVLHVDPEEVEPTGRDLGKRRVRTGDDRAQQTLFAAADALREALAAHVSPSTSAARRKLIRALVPPST